MGLWVGVLALLLAERAEACGGCFAPPSTISTVTGHRMAFSVSEQRTVLWDQFEYSGSPEEFSWVLPIAPGAYLEEASQAWFDALESLTVTRVRPPPLVCASSGNSGCGTMAASSDAEGGPLGGNLAEPPVIVLDRRTVGPYETVTLRSTEGDELVNWLTDNGYVVPPDIEPVIGAYVEEDADFIALKLRPGQGVQQMTPVRVVTPGGDGILPLRMVAAGVQDQVDIVLFVIGEQRYSLPDLHQVQVDAKQVTFDFAENDSDYSRIRASLLSENGGASVLTSYAEDAAFSKPFTTLISSSNGFFAFDFWDLYFAEAVDLDQATPCIGAAGNKLASDTRVVDNPESAELPNSGAFVCDGHSDLAAALVGLRPSKTWLTRLEMSLPRTALSMDCVVEPAESQTRVDNWLTPGNSIGRPSTCEQPIFDSNLSGTTPRPDTGAGWSLGLVLLAGMLRRFGLRRGRA